jgi:aspartyl aminopeptidase
MDQATFNQGLLEFIKASPTPFHAVATMAEQLVAAGFQQLHGGDNWQLQSDAKYFVTQLLSPSPCSRDGMQYHPVVYPDRLSSF